MDIGGTKMAVGVVDRDGALIASRRVATPDTQDAEELFIVLAAEVGLVLAEGGGDGVLSPAACGVGCGGPMSAGGETVSPLNIPAWRDFPLRGRLEALTGLPTGVENDAKSLALGEGWCGAAHGRQDFMAMVVSTGVGGGIVLDGRLLHGAAGNAGHVGHVVVEPDGRRCACGGRGCLEAEASGTAIAATSGRPPAEAGDEVIERSGRLVGRAVASVVALLDLELAVVSGGVALGFGAPFFTAANRELHERAGLSFARSAEIVPGALGARGPLVGAGAVGWRTVGRPVGAIAP